MNVTYQYQSFQQRGFSQSFRYCFYAVPPMYLFVCLLLYAEDVVIQMADGSRV